MTGFDDLVKGVMEDQEYNDKQEFNDKLKVLKNRIKPWVAEQRMLAKSDIVLATEKINDIELKIDEQIVTKEELTERLELINKLHGLHELDEMDIAQKSKVKWCVEGDKNTKFFHGLLKHKRSKYNIQGLSLNGVWVTDPALIKNAFKEFYILKFQKDRNVGHNVELTPQLTLSTSDNEMLQHLVIEEDIRRAVWDCGNDKSSGPDGFTFFFVKKILGVVEGGFNEVHCQCVQDKEITERLVICFYFSDFKSC
ncbi:uncharacterized protein [Rutidosis leptorrhynchoides]|uniref:uncharacterized protein n=1 Tax=Rutidosis leptorrhynchoides TaxID=125765 RepID=UPI003A99895C